jgi:3-oxoacyl-[acyl-carrier protein] reductase
MPLMSCELPVTIISGGSRGLGRALVEQALSRGDRVATFSRVPGPFVESLLADPVTRDRIYWESVDASNAEAAAGFAMAVMHRFGRIDTLINNAGVGIEGLLTTMSRASIASGIAINLSSVIALTQASVKCMLVGGSGCIINVSSVNGLRGHKGLAVYSATKAALVGFTISLAREVGAQGIRVNAIAPGFFESEMVSHMSDGQRERIMRRTPLRRLCTIDDLVRTVIFLQ